MATELPLNGFYAGTSQKNSDRRCVNWIPCGDPEGSLSTNYLDCPAGIDGVLSVASIPFVAGGRVTSQVVRFENTKFRPLIFAKDAGLVSASESSVSIQALTPVAGAAYAFTDYARFTATDNKLVMVCPPDPNFNENHAFSFDKDLVETPIVISSLFPDVFQPGFVDVCFAGGRVVWVASATQGPYAYRCYYSDIGSAAPDSGNFFQADDAASELVGIESIGGQVYVFSRESIYNYSISQSETTPFQWSRASTINAGLAGAMAKAKYKNTIVFVGRRQSEGYKVFLLSGGDVTSISTPAVDYLLNSRIGRTGGVIESQVSVFTFTENGRDFTAISGGSGNASGGFTLVYGHADGRWHERESEGRGGLWQVSGYQFGRNVGLCVGDAELNGGTLNFRIGKQYHDIGTEFGEMMDRYMISGPINADNRPLRVSEIEPVCEVDLTEPVAGFENPKIAIAPSYDFGNTFESERSLNIGSSGNYTQRTRFLNFGLVRQALVVKFRAHCPYPVRLLRMLTRIQPGGRES